MDAEFLIFNTISSCIAEFWRKSNQVKSNYRIYLLLFDTRFQHIFDLTDVNFHSMRWTKSVTMVEAHAEGEVGRVVTGGIIDVPGSTMVEKLHYMNGEGDALRRFLVFEPRGYAQMSTVLLLPASNPEAHAGMIVLQGDKAHAMSGSNAICTVTVLLETGIVEMREPQTTVVLDTPAGLVTAAAECSDGKCVNVQLEMTPCYVDASDAAVDVTGIGTVRLDIAFGGIFYALVDPEQIGLKIETQAAKALVEAGSSIQRAANHQLQIAHPEHEALNGLSYVMFIAETEDGMLKGATIMPPGRVDRSPCGTGNSARLALMHARGEIQPGDCFEARSIIDSCFEVRLLRETENYGKPAVVPSIKGRGWIHGIHQIGIDPSDPYPNGYSLSDCWGDAFDLVN